jgi:uncharacterized protein YndB with AHSA1/START domain
MGHQFEGALEADVDATVDEIWSAIATGPGIDSWFMGRNEVADGVVRTVFGGYLPEATITEAEPGKRFAYGTAPAPDGRYVAYDFLIESRSGASTSLRLVASGFLPGDDWADEYDAMTKGGALFFRTLIEYLTFFAGRTATPVTASGPAVADWTAAWDRLGAALGLDRAPREGDTVALGTVYFVNDSAVAIRTPDAMLRFVRGLHGPILAMHHLFSSNVDAAAAGLYWQTWLHDNVNGG